MRKERERERKREKKVKVKRENMINPVHSSIVFLFFLIHHYFQPFIIINQHAHDHNTNRQVRKSIFRYNVIKYNIII